MTEKRRRKGKTTYIEEGDTTKVTKIVKEKVRNLVILLKKMVLIVIMMSTMKKLFMLQLKINLMKIKI